MRVAEPITQCADAVHDRHRAPENGLDCLLGMLVRRELQRLGCHTIELRELFFVRVGYPLLVKDAFTDSLQEGAGDCYCTFRVGLSATESLFPDRVNSIAVKSFESF